MNCSSKRIAALPVAVVIGVGALLSGCGSDSQGSSADTTSAPVTTEAPAGGEITVTGQWARTSPKMTTAGAAYMEITNGTDTDDALIGAAVDPSIAATVEVHETAMGSAGEGDGMDGGMEGGMGEDDMTPTTEAHGEGSMMTMRPVDEIPIAAGETVVLEPGGYHVMMLDLVAPLESGTTIKLVLTFADAGDIIVEVGVRDTAP